MNILFTITAVIALILLITGGVVHSLEYLMWTGLILLIATFLGWAIQRVSRPHR